MSIIARNRFLVVRRNRDFLDEPHLHSLDVSRQGAIFTVILPIGGE